MPQCAQINHDEHTVRFLYVKYHHFTFWFVDYDTEIYINYRLNLENEGILYVISKYYEELLSS